MFKEIFDLLRKESQLHQAFERSREMLEEDQEMFLAAQHSLREHDDARIEIDIYAKDQLINAYEREVRRRVLTHLAVTKENVQAGLVLVSVVIDIERIGDLTKNIVSLALAHPKRLECGSFERDVRKIETTVKTMFSILLEALPTSDVAKAKEVMSEHWWISRRVEDINNHFITEEAQGLEVSDAVTTVLYLRFLKRISAHLMNIASSVVNPFDRIGFRSDDPNDKLERTGRES